MVGTPGVMYESTALGEQTLSPVLLCPARHWPCHQVRVLSTGPQQPCSTSRKKKRAAPCAPGACNSGRYAALGIFSTQRKRWQLILRLVNFPCNTPALSPSCDPSCYRLLFCWNASFHLFHPAISATVPLLGSVVSTSFCQRQRCIIRIGGC